MTVPAADNPTMQGGSQLTSDSNREKPAQPRHQTVRETAQSHGVEFPFTVAAPSFVIPAGAAENSRFLSDFFTEIGLLFFETDACLAYTEDDLPPDLADLSVTWHVHLPLDLPWQDGLDAAWAAIKGLMDKTAYLSPRCWVLHPPTVPGMLAPLADKLRAAGVDPRDILLENIDGSDLTDIWEDARQDGYSTCLDLGHVLAYDQRATLTLPGLWDTVRMLHVYAPGQGGRHTGLAHLDEGGQQLLRQMLEFFEGDALTMEVFEETELFRSIDLLGGWMRTWDTQR